MKIHRSIYSIDKIDINTYLDIIVLKDLLPIEKLKNECNGIFFRQAGEKGKLCGYKSKIIIIVPKQKCFELLALPGMEDEDYRISYIEIAMDNMKRSMLEAKQKCYDIMYLIRKKYTNIKNIFDARGLCLQTNVAFEQGKFSEQTGYYGNNILEFVVYARISKINSQPCIHSEWSIRDSGNIKKRLKIETFDDCYFFDIKEAYEKLTSEYIVLEEIDHDKLGKWMRGWGRRNNFTRRQKMSISMAAQTMLNAEGITTAAQLARWFKNEKKRLSRRQERNQLGTIKYCRFNQIACLVSPCLYNNVQLFYLSVLPHCFYT